jgi:rhodanese-related sulfurtransferase
VSSIEITPQDFLKQYDPKNHIVLDVRQDWEIKIAFYDNAQILNAHNFDSWIQASRDYSRIFILCHHGVRSLHAAKMFQDHKITHVQSIQGGIDALGDLLEPPLTKY